MRPILMMALAALLASACATVDRHAEAEGPLPEGVVNCVNLRQVDRIQIMDEQHILFRLHGGKMYTNHLLSRCPGLRRDDTIMYRTTLNQLCHLDMFTILRNIGGGFMPGATCAFGRFHPTTEEEIEDRR
ncbi:MAG TPA: DUF6491 family protein [Woeseiaceae bacterium]|nr:DUF6491 family protein [Woeseiaceae bacterium]